MSIIRIAEKTDVPGIMDIYSPHILNSGITQETEIPSLKNFTQRVISNLEDRPWLICEINGDVAGYAYAGKHRERKGYQWCIEPSVYLHKKYYGKGVAHALYTALFELLKLQGFVNAYAVITLPNEKSVSFHEKFGFRYLTTYRKIGFKLGQWHDVGWWEMQINPAVQDPKDPVKFPSLELDEVSKILLRASDMIRK